MALSREIFYLNDFTGGLNLTTQLQSLSPNESPDALNVDFGQRGGFVTRGGFQSQDYSTVWDGARFIRSANFGSDKLWIQADDAAGSLYSWDGASLTDTGHDLTDDSSERVRGDVMGGVLYMANGRASGAINMYSFDGTTLTTLGNSFNDTYASPTGNNMPKARYVAQHNGHLFVADTVESGTRYASRLRFSHLQQPEDWATNDYIDVDETDNSDPITSIVTFQETLLIFKRSSVWVLFGDDKDNFTLERLSSATGVCTCGAMAGHSGVMYWFATDGSLMAYNGTGGDRRGVTPVTDTLRWWSDLGRIKHGGAHRLMWHEGRLWLNLEAGSGESVSRYLFVWDPSVGRRGALTRYDPQVTEFYPWFKLGDDSDPLFTFLSDNNLYRFDRQYSYDTVDAGSGPVTSRVDAYYTTSWLTAGETSTRKRWKRPRITAASEGDATIRMGVFHDYSTERHRDYSWVIDAPEAAEWDTAVWDVDVWATDADDTYDFRRVISGGTARAIQFRFSCGDNESRWWIDSIAVPFRRKNVK